MLQPIVQQVEFISPEKAVVTAICGDGTRKQIVTYEEGTKVQCELLGQNFPPDDFCQR